MKAIAVINPKGGCGKSTLATNLAGYLARRNATVILGDVDRQLSSKLWLSLRPASLPKIETWETGSDNVARPPKGVLYAVLDTPAGLLGGTLEKVVKASYKIIVPVLASPFDLWATQAFLDQVLEIKAVAKHSCTHVWPQPVPASSTSTRRRPPASWRTGRPCCAGPRPPDRQVSRHPSTVKSA